MPKVLYQQIEEVILNSEGYFTLRTNSETHQFKALIVATGATPRYLGIAKEKELIGHGVTSCATCDGAFYRDVPVCVVGGGDSACEEANFLTRFASKVYLIHRRDQLRASKIMADRVIKDAKIEVIWDSQVVEYQIDKEGEVEGIILQNLKTNKQSSLKLKCVFIAIGHVPNSRFLGDLVEVDSDGYIQQVSGKTETKTRGLFVAGDVADHYYRQAVTAAGQGCAAALEAERYLSAL